MNSQYSESQNAALIHPWQVCSMQCQGNKQGIFFVWICKNDLADFTIFAV